MACNHVKPRVNIKCIVAPYSSSACVSQYFPWGRANKQQNTYESSRKLTFWPGQGRCEWKHTWVLSLIDLSTVWPLSTWRSRHGLWQRRECREKKISCRGLDTRMTRHGAVEGLPWNSSRTEDRERKASVGRCWIMHISFCHRGPVIFSLFSLNPSSWVWSR